MRILVSKRFRRLKWTKPTPRSRKRVRSARSAKRCCSTCRPAACPRTRPSVWSSSVRPGSRRAVSRSNTRLRSTASSNSSSGTASDEPPEPAFFHGDEKSQVARSAWHEGTMAKAAKVLLNVPAIKADFPIFERTVHDRRLVYLDSAATSQKPKQVIDAMTDYYTRYNANVHRAIYELGEEATREYEGAREKIAAFIRAKSPNEIVFTKSTTESLNVVAYGYGLKGKLQAGDKIVAVTLCSNVLGTINPVKEIARRAHEVGAVCVVAAAQAAPHMSIDVQDLDADFLAFSGHKMLGPTGIGVLYGKPEALEATEPLLGGGEMIREVHLGRSSWNDVPYRFEGGTPNIAGAIGLGVAVDYLTKLGMEAVRAHEMEVTQYALERIGRINGVKTYGPKDVQKKAGVLAFTIENAHPHDVASILDVEGICIRSGHHCAQPLMERFDLPATARASFYVYNDLEDVDALVAGIKRVQEVFA